MSEFFGPDIVGSYEKERQARSSLDAIMNAAVTAADTDYPQAPKPAKPGKPKKTSADIYARQLQRLLRSGEYRQPYDELTNQLNTMGQQAEGTIGSSMDQLKTFLQGQANPYANFQAQQTQVSPALAGLLQSQGVSTDPLQQFAGAVNAQNAGQATAFQNLANTLGTLYGAQQQGMVQDVEANRANALAALGASRMGMGAQINQQALGQRNQLMEMLLSAISQGGRPKAGRLF